MLTERLIRVRSSPVKGRLVHRFDHWKLLSEILNATRSQIWGARHERWKRYDALKIRSVGKSTVMFFSAQQSYDACIISDVLFHHYFNISTVKESVILKLFQINVFLYISWCFLCGQFPATWRRLQRRWGVGGMEMPSGLKAKAAPSVFIRLSVLRLMKQVCFVLYKYKITGFNIRLFVVWCPVMCQLYSFWLLQVILSYYHTKFGSICKINWVRHNILCLLRFINTEQV